MVKGFSLNEAVDYYLDNFEVSTDDSDNENDNTFQSANIFNYNSTSSGCK